MLSKTSITNITVQSDEWFRGRLAKWTSSEAHYLTATEGLGAAGMKYIWRKVGEELTGVPCRTEITTSATEHGHEFEPENIRNFGIHMGLDFVVIQKLIVPVGQRIGSTPDALIIVKESADQLSYQVKTVEAKCPPSYDNYIQLWNCSTPEEIKRVERKYYWQVIHQMHTCDALEGYLSIYHPFFKAGQLNIIQFKKVNLIQDFKLLKDRLILADQVFEEQRDRMIASPIKVNTWQKQPQ
jgi:hypothetical protein